jgi:hypothetical protein
VPSSTPIGWRPHIVFFVRARYSANASCAAAAVPDVPGSASSAVASWSSARIDSEIACDACGPTLLLSLIAGVSDGGGSG